MANVGKGTSQTDVFLENAMHSISSVKLKNIRDNLLSSCYSMVVNSHGIIEQFDILGENFGGYSYEDFIGNHMRVLFTEKDMVEKLLFLASKKNNFLHKCIMKKKSGQFFGASCKLIALSGGKESKFNVIIKDITYKLFHEEIENQLRREFEVISNEENLYENNLIGIFKFNISEGKILRANKRFREIITLRTLSDFSIGKYQLSLVNLVHIKKKLLQEGRVDGYKLSLRHPETKDCICILLSCMNSENPDYVEGFIVDVTNDEKHTQKLKEANEQLDHFFYRISHDLRSPISSMLGLVNLMRIDEAHDPLLYVEMIENKVKRMDSLIHDMMHIYSNEYTHIKYDSIDFPREIEGLLQESFADVLPEIKLATKISQNDVVFYSDLPRIKIILINLLSNAFKYKDMHREASVELVFECSEKEVKIVVKDNGTGIEEEYIDRIFEMFYRASDQSDGAGLGLYIVKNMIEKLEGSIYVASQKGKGTCITIFIPNNHPKASELNTKERYLL